MNLFQPFADLKSINKQLRLAVIALFIYFISRIISELAFAISDLFDGRFVFSDFLELINYQNFVNIFALIFLYLSIRNKSQLPTREREEFISSSILTIFTITYVLSFYFIERIISLTPTDVSSLPSAPTYFLPFDWYNIRSGYESITTGYAFDFYVYRFIATLISALSITFVLYSLIASSKSKENGIKPRFNLTNLWGEIGSLRRKSILILFSIPFTFLTIENIKASNYSSLYISVSMIQDDLKDYKKDLEVANSETFSTDMYEARKVAANKAYKEMNTAYQNMESNDLSFWSGNLKELKSGILDWIQLWEKNLRQVSIDGYGDKETVFDLTQQYYELNKLGEFRAPMLASSYQIQYWRDEFYPLVK
jgi:hypothetical protein